MFLSKELVHSTQNCIILFLIRFKGSVWLSVETQDDSSSLCAGAGAGALYPEP